MSDGNPAYNTTIVGSTNTGGVTLASTLPVYAP